MATQAPYDRPVYDRPYSTSGRDFLLRSVVPLLIALLLGYWLGWATGRNNLLEKTLLPHSTVVEHDRTITTPNPQ